MHEPTHPVRSSGLAAVRSEFLALHKLESPTTAERQGRGYALERLMVDLFEAYDLEYRKSYRLAHEQVDGSFNFRGFTYIVEIKWESTPPGFGDLAKFKANVDGKLDSTRGLFIAMAGFDANTVTHLVTTARGSKNNVILMDGQDLSAIFEGLYVLPDALTAKIDAAEQEGRPWHPLGR